MFVTWTFFLCFAFFFTCVMQPVSTTFINDIRVVDDNHEELVQFVKWSYILPTKFVHELLNFICNITFNLAIPILAALVAGNPLTLVTHVLLTDMTSRCVLPMADR